MAKGEPTKVRINGKWYVPLVLRINDLDFDGTRDVGESLLVTGTANRGIVLFGDQDEATTDTGTEVCNLAGLTCVGAMEANGTELANCATAATGSTSGWFYAVCR